MTRKPTLVRAAAATLITLAAGAPALADGPLPNILITGYWPPTNEMIRPFSTNPTLNPDGWIGENWEGRGYDVHSYFPEFMPPNCSSCGQGMGDLEVDYQDTSSDFWPIANALEPIAVITFSRGSNDMSWELEMNQFNRSSWINDYTAPLQPTPSPPDASVPVGYLRPSQLPVNEIVDAIAAAGLGLSPFVCYTGDGGGFLSEFIAYHGVWYQDLHGDSMTPDYCAAAGHVHVGGQVSWPTAQAATEVTLRTVMDLLDHVELSFFFPDGQPRFIDPFGGQRIRVEVSSRTKIAAPGTGMLHYSTDAMSYTVIPMEEIEPNVYDAVFPAFDCGQRVLYYFSAESQSGEVVLSPFGAPDATYGADAYNAEVLTFADDFENDLGWTVADDAGVDDGGWARGTPTGGPLAPGADADGSGQCYVTGLAPGQDIDGGYSVLMSPTLDASDPESSLIFEQWFAASSTGGLMLIEMSDDDGGTWNLFEILRQQSSDESWIRRELRIADIGDVDNTSTFRVRFRIGDFQDTSTVEGGIDGVKILTGFTCSSPCTSDLDESGTVDFGDLLRVLSAWGPCKACPEDLDGSGAVDFGDLLAILSDWGPC